MQTSAYFAGKIVLITGAGSGISKALSETIAAFSRKDTGRT